MKSNLNIKRFRQYTADLKAEYHLDVFDGGGAIMWEFTNGGTDCKRLGTFDFAGFTPEQELAAFIALCQMAEQE